MATTGKGGKFPTWGQSGGVTGTATRKRDRISRISTNRNPPLSLFLAAKGSRNGDSIKGFADEGQNSNKTTRANRSDFVSELQAGGEDFTKPLSDF